MEDIGTVRIVGQWDDSAGRRINRIEDAARRLRVSRELIATVQAAGGDYTDEYSRVTLVGDVLTIRDDYGQRFIYRIHWDDYADGGYLAEWPD